LNTGAIFRRRDEASLPTGSAPALPGDTYYPLSLMNES
jgi:hypothetical protein